MLRLESYSSDLRSRSEAKRIWADIRSRISYMAREDTLRSALSSDGKKFGIAVSELTSLDFLDYGLVLVFVAKNEKYKAGFGMMAGRPTIVLTALIAPGDLRHLDTRISTMEHIFVHEYIHYLNFFRSKRKIQGGAQATNDAEYYNSPAEFDSFTQETLSRAEQSLAIARQHKEHPKVSKTLLGRNPVEFIAAQLNGDKGVALFYQNLNQRNKRRFQARMASFWSEKVKPFIDSQQSDKRTDTQD